MGAPLASAMSSVTESLAAGGVGGVQFGLPPVALPPFALVSPVPAVPPELFAPSGEPEEPLLPPEVARPLAAPLLLAPALEDPPVEVEPPSALVAPTAIWPPAAVSLPPEAGLVVLAAARELSRPCVPPVTETALVALEVVVPPVAVAPPELAEPASPVLLTRTG